MSLTEEYQGIDIEYREDENRWFYVRDGRERSATSLREAKEAIRKPLPKKKGQVTFKKFEAWHQEWSNEYKKVTVTSIADGLDYRRKQQVWISDGKNRSKVSVTDVFPCSPDNDQMVAEMAELEKQRESLDEQIEAKKQRLISYNPPEA